MKNLILLNGICVWHESFENKAAAWREYYVTRNKMIVNSIHCENYTLKSVFSDFFHYPLYLTREGRFNEVNSYLDGINDFLNGSNWLSLQDGESLHGKVFQKSKRQHGKVQSGAKFAKIGLRLLFEFSNAKKSYRNGFEKLITKDFWGKYLGVEK